MRIDIPKFDVDTLNPEGFIDWLVAVEEVFEFKEVPENKKASLITTTLRGMASAWWQQLKLTCERVSKPRVSECKKAGKRHLFAGEWEIDDVDDEDYEETLIFDNDPQYELGGKALLFDPKSCWR
ncbi:hypothetical protein Tco_1358348 [Tanacetum coccineum]